MTFRILRATELPIADGLYAVLEGLMGLYKFGHNITKEYSHNYCCEWAENCAVSITNMQFPKK